MYSDNGYDCDCDCIVHIPLFSHDQQFQPILRQQTTEEREIRTPRAFMANTKIQQYFTKFSVERSHHEF